MTALHVRTVKRYYCKCERCGHSWQTESTLVPKRCAKCKRPNWNVPAGVLPLGRPSGKRKPRSKR